MSQITHNFLDLALDDYRAARLLLRQGLLVPGAATAAMAVEKELKAVLALKQVFTKKHLDSGLLAKACMHFPQLVGVVKPDFIKFLGRAFTLRYASVDSAGFSIIINQHRTLMELDSTMLSIDSGVRLKRGGVAHGSPLQIALGENDPLLVDDNVPLKRAAFKDIADRPNKMIELRVGTDLQVLSARYETEGLNIIGEFCKKTDIDFHKTTWQLALG